jgi:hypothetical protein
MGYGQGEIGPSKPPSYLGYTILVAAICCVPIGIYAAVKVNIALLVCTAILVVFGVVSIGYALLTVQRNASSDLEGAKQSSDMAERWMYAGMGVLALVLVGCGIFYLLHRFTS